MKKFLFFISTLLLANQAFAADQQPITSWKIDNSKSKIEYVAYQNGTKITGGFEKFSGEINFDKDNLDKSKAIILVDMNSVTASLPEAPGMLKAEGWFGVKKFPTAEFRSDKFTKGSNNQFHINGTLTLKGIKVPVGVDFSFDEYSKNHAIAKGQVSINRLDFEVGKKDENGVKDLVMVKFVITAKN